MIAGDRISGLVTCVITIVGVEVAGAHDTVRVNKSADTPTDEQIAPLKETVEELSNLIGDGTVSINISIGRN